MTLQPVSTLSLGQAYRQLVAQASAPRLSDGRLAITHRLHFYVESTQVRTFFQNLKDGSWSPAVDVPSSVLADPAQVETTVQSIFALQKIPLERCALVLHLAAPFVYNQLKSVQSDVPRRVLLSIQPARVIAEEVSDLVQTYSWIEGPFSITPIAPRCDKRVYLGVVSAAGKLSRSGLFSVQAVSAPFEALALATMTARLDQAPHASLMWLYYEGFSLVAGIEPGGRCAGLSRYEHGVDKMPGNIARGLNETALALNLTQPRVIIVRCGSQPVDLAIQSLSNSLQSIKPTFSTENPLYYESGATNRPPNFPYELGLWDASAIPAGFPHHLYDWAFSSFYEPSMEEKAAIVSPAFARAAALIHHTRWFGWLLVLFVLTWGSWSVLRATRAPEWEGSDAAVNVARQTLTSVQADIKTLTTFSNRFSPRISSLFCFQLLPALFPEQHGVTVDRVSFENRIEPVRVGAGSGGSRHGMELRWDITGSATGPGTEYLQSLSGGSTVAQALEQAARRSGIVFDPSVDISANNRFNESAGGDKLFTFTLVVRIPNSSPAALPRP